MNSEDMSGVANCLSPVSSLPFGHSYPGLHYGSSERLGCTLYQLLGNNAVKILSVEFSNALCPSQVWPHPHGSHGKIGKSPIGILNFDR